MLPIYGAIIKVIAGFYLGCTGYLIAPDPSVYKDKFQVRLFCTYKNPKDPLALADVSEIDTVLNTSDFQIISNPR